MVRALEFKFLSLLLIIIKSVSPIFALKVETYFIPAFQLVMHSHKDVSLMQFQVNACVKVGRTSGVEIQTMSLCAVSTNSRFCSYSAPWAGPRSWPTLSLQTTGRLTLRGPASKEVDREETFPSPESPMADDG